MTTPPLQRKKRKNKQAPSAVLGLILIGICVVGVALIVLFATGIFKEIPNPNTARTNSEELGKALGVNTNLPYFLTKEEDVKKALEARYPNAGPQWQNRFYTALMGGCPATCVRWQCACKYDIRTLEKEAAAFEAGQSSGVQNSSPSSSGELLPQLIAIAVGWVIIFTIFGGITLFKIPYLEKDGGKVTVNTVLFVGIAATPSIATLGIVNGDSSVKLMWQVVMLVFAGPFIGYIGILFGRATRALDKSTKKSVLILKKLVKVANTFISCLNNVSGLIPAFGIPWVALWAVYLGMSPIQAGLIILLGVFMTQGLTCMIGSYWLYYSAGVNFARIMIHESDKEEDEQEEKGKSSPSLSSNILRDLLK